MKTNASPDITDQITDLDRQRFQAISEWIHATADEFVEKMMDGLDTVLDGGRWQLDLLGFIDYRSTEIGWTLEELFGQIEDLQDKPVRNLEALADRIALKITDKYSRAGISSKAFFPTVKSTHRCGTACESLRCYTVHIQSTDYRG
jgi:hypothetical protein